MSWESKPEVISTPIQQQNSHTYIRRRLGFLYHGTLSSATRRVTMGSAADPTLTILAVLTIDDGLEYETETAAGSNGQRQFVSLLSVDPRASGVGC